MRGSGSLGRGLVLTLGVVLTVGGLAGVSTGAASPISAVWVVVFGLVLIVAAIVERYRYRSETAERTGLPVGPGGGEPLSQSLETRFRRTDEVFIDPTSERRMRVWLDQETGERRYRAED
jgi:hypothetical protein